MSAFLSDLNPCHQTEVLHIGHQREELDIELDGKKLTQGFKQLLVPRTGTVCGDRKVEREVEGVMADRRITKRLKGKVLSTCVTPACLYGTESLAMTELQQQRPRVCENNWVPTTAKE